jgi:putative ABC transport system permease protein
MGKGEGVTPQTPIHIGPMLKGEQTFIENYTRIHPFNFDSFTLKTGEKAFKETGVFRAEPTFFDVFTHPMLAGNSKTALAKSNSIVLTESLAVKYFNTKDCLGKMLLVDYENYEVTGVIQDLPSNSDLSFKALISYQFGEEEDWDDIRYFTYVLTTSSKDAPKLNATLSRIEENYIKPYYKEMGSDMSIALLATPLREVHFTRGMVYDTPKSNYIYIYLFLAIGLFILCIASFNYINLAAVQSFKRSKEVGIKGMLGVGRWQVVLEFVVESVILTLISLLASIIFVSVVLPYFNALAQIQIPLSTLLHWRAVLMLVGIILILGVISAVVPAVFLTSFSIQKIIKGKLPNFNRGLVFRGLLVAQFAMSIIVIICTLAVYEQMQYMKKKGLGFLMDKVVIIHLPDEMDYNANLALKKELSQYSSLRRVSLAGDSSIPGSGGIEKSEAVIHMDDNAGMMDVFNLMAIDEDYLQLLNIELVAGKNFSHESKTSNRNAFIVNEAFVKHVGWKDAINKEVKLHNGGVVIGVVKDYNYKSLHNKIEPLILFYNQGGPNNEMLIKIESEKDLDLIEKTWNKYAGKHPLSFSFLDQSFDKQYQQESGTMKLFLIFSLLVIVLTCLGLFGLSSLVANQRVKEIGIRKVLGAPEHNLVFVLLKDIVVLLLISIFIAAPVAKYGVDLWQQDFAYRAYIGVTIYALAWSVALCTTLFTTFFHTFRTIRTNPALSLRHD